MSTSPSSPVAAGLEHRFRSTLRTPTVTARIGLALGISFGICFLTGLVSHYLQHPPSWFAWPTRPVSLYRWTQGLHVVTGTAAVPLLGVKLWSVYPKLFAGVHLGSLRTALVTVVERASIAVLVGASLFLLLSGYLNTAQYYPWAFFFTSAHYAVAWVAIGALLVHIAVKLPVIRTALGVPVSATVDADTLEVTPAPTGPTPATLASPAGPTRRTVLRATWVAAGVAVLATAGATVPLLRRVSLLATRTGEGPQGVPINRSAEAAGVQRAATAADWRLTVAGPGGEQTLTLDDVLAMTPATEDLPIACVEGWSASATWTGVPVADLVALVGGSTDADVRFTSLDTGLYGSSVLPARHARDRTTLLATHLNGEVLSLDHGFPVRLIAPSRPGVTQTKWVSRVDVL